MFKIKLADLVMQIDNKYKFTESLCKDYLTSDENVDFYICCTDEEIDAEERGCPYDGLDRGYMESICIYRQIAHKILERDAFLVHSAVIEVDGSAYAFLARSGVGKSTHISLWKRAFGDRAQIINGDKPIYRYIGDDLYAYGTPWCGKEGWNKNTRARLKALCYIERAPENEIKELSPEASAERIMKQILMPRDAVGAIKTLDLIDRMLKNTKSWLLSCNISTQAAEIAYNAMSKE